MVLVVERTQARGNMDEIAILSNKIRILIALRVSSVGLDP